MEFTVADRTYSYQIEEDDVPFEEEILRHSYNVPSWTRYVDHKLSKKSSFNSIFMIYERALKHLPGSYKLWNAYLKLRRHCVREKCISDPAYEQTNEAHERALIFMSKMPRIWIEYCKFLMFQRFVTRTRRVFDTVLQTLPITQHSRIWPLYIEFLNLHDIPETGIVVFRRYLKLQPENVEDYVDYLVKYDRIDEAVQQLLKIVNQPDFKSKKGKSNHQLWFELCQLICKNPDKVKSVKVAEIIKNGLQNFTDGLGDLWCSLGDYYIRYGLFEKARDVYEEGMVTVLTVKDFGQIFDVYSQFMDTTICYKIQEMREKGVGDDVELDMLMERYEDLMDRRPILLNSVLLRQNKHNVNEWIKRAQLFEGRPSEIIKTFTEAIQTVDPKYAVGHPNLIWTEFAKFYESNGQLAEARAIFEKGVLSPFKQVEDLANLWCDYAEMELRKGDHEIALRVLRRGTSVPSKKIKVDYHDERDTAQSRVHKSIKLWSFYVDMEENFGSFETTKSAYSKVVSMKIANPQIILNYTKYLEDSRYFEESFKVYEQGVNLFKWPHVNEIWAAYITRFIKHYKSTKLERLRDLFEQCLSSCPPKYCFNFYVLYGMIEEQYGLARRALAVYERACNSVNPCDKLTAYSVYVSRAAELFGITSVRDIFDKALEVLSDEDSRTIGLEYAQVETKIGEIDRSRAIYSYLSQISNPETTESFWKAWYDFEVAHGNEETFREMRRIRRTMEAKFSIQPSLTASHMISVIEESASKPMEALEKQVERSMTQETQSNNSSTSNILPFTKNVAFVKASKPETQPVLDKESQKNDAEDKESSVEGAPLPIAEKPVPAEVFGSLVKKNET
ncbi:Pre-mRNA-splicing factor SYF1 [Thelohanellus kitauei]|uniref:Pre-mRNA-splicing factor SYF1 n=1 Tax=Thelohanellus kitauei TaxID=669202 RepID=A0A0C2J1N9_THEKT|nr:Pre-mRNA-splicing factor SYF1 [Thelohanellus kitauei]